MKTLKMSLAPSGVVALLAASLVTLSPQASFAQTDPWLGTWKLNLAKSTYSPGPPPKSLTVTIEAAGQGMKLVSKGIDAEGKATGTQYTANYDGKDYPVTGSQDYDTVALKHIDAFTLEATRKKAGTVAQIQTRVVSKDGKIMTNTVKGTNAKGQTINNVFVLEKQ